MSLQELFMQRAMLQHQNELAGDNIGPLLGGIAQGVMQGIQEEQAAMAKRQEEERQFTKGIERFNKLKKQYGDEFDVGFKEGKVIMSGRKIEKAEPTSTQIKLAEEGALPEFYQETYPDLYRLSQAKKNELSQETQEQKVKNTKEFNEYISKQANDIGDDFRSSETYENYIQIKKSSDDIGGTLQLALQQTDEGGKKNLSAIDQALVVSFNKMLDPGSVVRESEFNRTPESIALINRMRARMEKITTGGVGLTDADRKEIAKVSDILLTNAKRSLNKSASSFRKRAEYSNVPMDMIFGQDAIDVFGENLPDAPVSISEMEKQQKIDNQTKSTSSSFREGQTATNPETGEKIIYRGGKWQKL